jgi:hypothetical protein
MPRVAISAAQLDICRLIVPSFPGLSLWDLAPSLCGQRYPGKAGMLRPRRTKRNIGIIGLIFRRTNQRIRRRSRRGSLQRSVALRHMSSEPSKILSVKDGASLSLWPVSGRVDPDSFDFVLTTPIATIAGSGSTYVVGSPALFFRQLSDFRRGWKSELAWATLEREFSLSASSDKLGHIGLRVELRSSAGSSDWEFKYRLYLEAGSLERIARNLEQTFPTKVANGHH